MTHTYKFLFLFSLVYVSYFISAETPNGAPPPTIVYNYINYDNNIRSDVTSQSQSSAKSSANTTMNNNFQFSVEFQNIIMQCKQKIKETITPENYQTFKNFMMQTLWEYRYTAACATLVGSYSIISLLLVVDYYSYLQSNTLWARWKAEYNFEQLCTIPQKELTQELLTAINESNYNKTNPTDFTHPLIMFLTAIDKEIAICKRYITTAQTIKRLGLMKIFPTNDSKLEEVNKLLQRALFIKHIFLTWLTDYNLTICKNS